MGFKNLFSSHNKMPESSSSSTPNHDSHGETPLVSRAPSVNGASRRRTQVDELELVFRKFDANGDGKISASELGSIMENLGQPSTEEELLRIVREADKDGDGYIDLNEFVELNTKGFDVMESLKDAFAVFDIDGNGTISVEELHKVLRSLGETCTVTECRRMISGVDANGDGLINFDEFKVMMEKGSRFDSKERALSVKIN